MSYAFTQRDTARTSAFYVFRVFHVYKIYKTYSWLRV
jgi:hypothetical protein